MKKRRIILINQALAAYVCEDYLLNLSSNLKSTPKDLRVAHINICSLRYKMDEIRLLQRICRFDILAITETHLNASVPDNSL